MPSSLPSGQSSPAHYQPWTSTCLYCGSTTLQWWASPASSGSLPSLSSRSTSFSQAASWHGQRPRPRCRRPPYCPHHPPSGTHAHPFVGPSPIHAQTQRHTAHQWAPLHLPASPFAENTAPRILTNFFPAWTIWTLLFGLAVYDIFAVLAPCGPLKALVELSQERGDAIPVLPAAALPRPALSACIAITMTVAQWGIEAQWGIDREFCRSSHQLRLQGCVCAPSDDVRHALRP